jgi:hypothetical protein
MTFTEASFIIQRAVAERTIGRIDAVLQVDQVVIDDGPVWPVVPTLPDARAVTMPFG